ncbi:helix-turn-helix domain-containing protein [Flavobacterium sp.]
MLRLNLDRVFKVKGIIKTNQFLIGLGNSVGYASQLVNGRSISIRYDKLELLCKALNCTPNDLFDYKDDAENKLPAGHALYSIMKSDAINEVNKLLHDLPMEKIEELYKILKGTETVGE